MRGISGQNAVFGRSSLHDRRGDEGRASRSRGLPRGRSAGAGRIANHRRRREQGPEQASASRRKVSEFVPAALANPVCSSSDPSRAAAVGYRA